MDDRPPASRARSGRRARGGCPGSPAATVAGHPGGAGSWPTRRRRWCWRGCTDRPPRSPGGRGCVLAHGCRWRNPMRCRRSRSRRGRQRTTGTPSRRAHATARRCPSSSCRRGRRTPRRGPRSPAGSPRRRATARRRRPASRVRGPIGAITFAEVNVLPVPGGPCTARYDESRPRRAAVMSSATEPVRGRGSPWALRGARRNRMSVTASGGRSGSPAPTSAAAASIASVHRRRGKRRPRRERERELLVDVAAGGLLLHDHDLGGGLWVVAARDVDQPEPTSVRIVGKPAGGGRFVDRVHPPVEFAP